MEKVHHLFCFMKRATDQESPVPYHEQGHSGHGGLAKAIMIWGTPICWLSETLLVLSPNSSLALV